MDLNNLKIEDLKAKVLTFTDEKTLIKSGRSEERRVGKEC